MNDFHCLGGIGFMRLDRDVKYAVKTEYFPWDMNQTAENDE